MHSSINAVNYWAIVPAAGIGQRMQADKPKQYLMLHNKAIIIHTLACLASYSRIAKIIVVIKPEDSDWQSLVLNFPGAEKVMIAYGSNARCYSVLNGLIALEKLAKPSDWVLVHDAVRPLLTHQDIENLVSATHDHAVGGLLALPIFNTLKRTDAMGNVIATVDRENLWQALTPQIFRYGLLLQALLAVQKKQIVVTDEAAAIELMGEKPLIVEGSATNIKITKPTDLYFAEKFLA